jgi:ABC-type dipeptide/oligopeptide/nickel transport system permease component
MGSFVLRRLFQTLPVLVGITLVGFLLIRAAPGDLAEVALGDKATESALEAYRVKHGLHLPAGVQYVFYAARLATGDMGHSHHQKKQVTAIVFPALLVTLKLALGAMALALVLGVALGVLAAARPRGWIDFASMFAALIGVSIPAFWLAMILILVFGAWLQWFPISGYVPGELRYLVLPCLTLGLIMTAVIARLTRASVIEALGQDYVRTARAKGVNETLVVVRHALSNSLVPILTVVGNSTASLLAGAILTETVFSLPGLGKVVFDAIVSRDHFVLMGCLLVSGFAFVLVNLIVDILYTTVDPRISHERSDATATG